MINRLLKKLIAHKLLFITILPILNSCSSVTTKTGRSDKNDIIYLPSQQIERELAENKERGSLLRDLFMGKKNKSKSLANKLLVNPHLWQASLEVLSSTMPLASVDSSSGIIISDWYNIKNKQNERVKVSVLVSTQELRADGIKVSIFKQSLKSNTWTNTKINPDIIVKLERKIVQRAGVLANNSN